MEERRALENIALITASPVRVAIVSKLNREEPMSYKKLKSSVEDSLKREISDGSFAWHLEKLKGARLTEKISSPIAFQKGYVTGKRLGYQMRKKTSKEPEEEEAKEEFPKKAQEDLEIDRYYIEGYCLTEEGNEIKDAVRVAINKLKPPS